MLNPEGKNFRSQILSFSFSLRPFSFSLRLLSHLLSFSLFILVAMEDEDKSSASILGSITFYAEQEEGIDDVVVNQSTIIFRNHVLFFSDLRFCPMLANVPYQPISKPNQKDLSLFVTVLPDYNIFTRKSVLKFGRSFHR